MSFEGSMGADPSTGAMGTDNTAITSLPTKKTFKLFFSRFKLHKKRKHKKIEESTKILHNITHLEDVSLESPKNFKSIVLGLISHSNPVVIKYDGSPSLIFGKDSTGFFIGLKNVDVSKKYIRQESDIKKHYSDKPENLTKKLMYAFNTLAKLDIADNTAYQCDILFIKSDVVSHKKNQISFTPNVVTYNVTKENTDYNKIKNSLIGIVVHTDYNITDTGFNIISAPNHFHELTSQNVNGLYIHSAEILDDVKFDINSIKNKLNQLKLDASINNDDNYILAINYMIKNDIDISKDFDKGLSQFNKSRKMNLEFPTEVKSNYLISLDIKNDLLERLHHFKTILEPSTQHEGFVVFTDHGLIKLVDRYEFSSKNFKKNMDK